MTYTCGFCNKNIHANACAIFCNGDCEMWYHATCVGLDKTNVQFYIKERKKVNGKKWFCKSCECSDDKNDPDVTLGSQLNEEDKLEKIFMKYFSEFRSDVMKSIGNCTDVLEELRTKITLLEEENKKLKDHIESLKNNKSNAGMEYGYEDVIEEIEERQKRANNILISNVKESNSISRENRLEDDKVKVKDILQGVEVDLTDIKVFRMGKYLPSKSRLIKVVFKKREDAVMVLKNKNKIKVPSIQIFGDQTNKQRQYFQKIKSQLEEIKSNGDNSKTIKFVNNVPKIVARSSVPLN